VKSPALQNIIIDGHQTGSPNLSTVLTTGAKISATSACTTARRRYENRWNIIFHAPWGLDVLMR
jgi:hypothetical protein